MGVILKELANIISSRLLIYAKNMNCKPNRNKVASMKISNINIHIKSLSPAELLFLSGFEFEEKAGPLAYAKTKKAVKVNTAQEILKWLHLNNVAVTLPSTYHKHLFDCDLNENIVYEIWAPIIDQFELESVLLSKLSVAIPEISYIRDYNTMTKVLTNFIDNSKRAEIYVQSKFSRPGYLGKFIESFGGNKDIKVYLSMVGPIKKEIAKKIENYTNVLVTTTNSHRKIVVALIEDDGEYSVLGFHGSMNLFFPAPDDYMLSVNTLRDLQVIIHGILRSFIII